MSKVTPEAPSAQDQHLFRGFANSLNVDFTRPVDEISISRAATLAKKADQSSTPVDDAAVANGEAQATADKTYDPCISEWRSRATVLIGGTDAMLRDLLARAGVEWEIATLVTSSPSAVWRWADVTCSSCTLTAVARRRDQTPLGEVRKRHLLILDRLDTRRVLKLAVFTRLMRLREDLALDVYMTVNDAKDNDMNLAAFHTAPNIKGELSESDARDRQPDAMGTMPTANGLPYWLPKQPPPLPRIGNQGV
ncbi:uncharacterized protein ACA1_134080 [Acanthamoeba castellanii str. Neff]|uniref:Uncharacterized protein n=1 Tax=Acanthamoeba castellanii (strain ATCC 30010 / Neff) TaxID=1257118 RepID=L8GE95_ACACF|nr:uncharacterized protein ACA1_134080 [Acanthamoeba castellanii str. Neff]ELR11352.1 hypothetical protein ACA1_134080 [Acanthamoeba castellanii str. Neff]